MWTGTIGNPDPGDADEGTDSSKFALETGLKVLVRLTVAAGASTTTFNLNGTGSKTVYYR